MLHANGHANRQGQTPLMIACQKGRLDVAKALVAAGCNKEVVDGFGRTALSIATEKGLDHITSFLLGEIDYCS